MSDNELKIAQEYISYERLLEIAHKMHLWIFLHSGDDQYEYEQMGITEEENAILGSIYVMKDEEKEDLSKS